ncbi:hypothetical protein PENTCL1PPCAC_17748, partial [Pristionchus entomophagus]
TIPCQICLICNRIKNRHTGWDRNFPPDPRDWATACPQNMQQRLQCIMKFMQETPTLRNCTFRYSGQEDLIKFALWIDGPITFIAAILALVGAHFAVRFLRRAGLNRHLTAALFSLCLIDSLLMLTVFFFYSIEACSLLFFGTNFMYNRQAFTSSLHGVASSMTTASTLLVIWVTLQRFMVVLRPMRYAKAPAERNGFRRISYSVSTHREGTHRGEKKASIILSDSNGNATTATLSRNGSRRKSYRKPLQFKKVARSFIIPGAVIVLSFALNLPVFFEFTVEPCYDWETHMTTSCPSPTSFRNHFVRYKSILNSLSQTIGPVTAISIMTALTEYKVHRSLRERRKLFETRNRNVAITDELREKVSRTVAIFITIKFLILRSMPVFFDVYENLYGIEEFGTILSVLVRISDFMIVLNSATNSLAYFGKKTWLENRLRKNLIKKEERKQRKSSIHTSSMRRDSVVSECRRLSSHHPSTGTIRKISENENDKAEMQLLSPA